MEAAQDALAPILRDPGRDANVMALDHEYNPDPKTAFCLSCTDRPGSSRSCLWCGHNRGEHTGIVDPAVKLHLSKPNPHAGHGFAPDRISIVKWTTSACGMYHCACKQYELGMATRNKRGHETK